MKNSMEAFNRAQQMAAARNADPDALHIEQLVQARERLTAEDFREEIELDNTAFLRYRYMTPYERTEAFYAAYRAHYVNRFEKRTGRPPYQKAKRISQLSARQFTSAWRARQRADVMGMLYDQFVLVFLDHADAQGTEQVPQLNQLCDDEKFQMVIEKYDELKAAGRLDPFEAGLDPRFYAVNYVGHSQQLAALNMIEAEINALGPARRAGRLARYMKFRQVISAEEATRRFGTELVEAAQAERIGMTVSPEILASPQPTTPACLGLYCDAHPTCMQCPAKGACVERASLVDAEVLARYGVLDAPAQSKTDAARHRKQRQRERSGSTMTDQEQARILREAGDPKAKRKRERAKERRDAKKAKKAAKASGDEKPE